MKELYLLVSILAIEGGDAILHLWRDTCLFANCIIDRESVETFLKLHMNQYECIMPIDASQHTFHGLFNSKPSGASGRSDCPLKKPVNRLSLSITSIQSAACPGTGRVVR
jgi:hypothetical protein